MKRIALVVALLLFNNIGISYSALPVPKTQTIQWEVLYRKATEHLEPKNKYELEWERLNQEITDSSVRRDDPDDIVDLAEQTYDYALKHLGAGHPFAHISYTRLLFDIYVKNERYEEGKLLYMYGWVNSQLLSKEEKNKYFKQWEEFYAKGRKPIKKGELHEMQIIMAAERAYDYAKQYLGPEHPATLISIDQLFMFYYNSDRYREAESLCNQSIEIRKKLLGPEHPATLSSIHELIKLYATMGRNNQAELLGKKLLLLRKKVLGEEHADTLLSLEGRASRYSSQGREREIEPILKELLCKYKRMHGVKHFSTIRMIRWLAQLYLSQERRNDAEPLLQEWAEVVKDTVWEPELADAYKIQGKHSKAEYLLKEMLDLPDKFMFPTAEGGRISLKIRLANLYADQERYSEAEQLHKEVIEIQERWKGRERKNNIDSIRVLAVLNKLQGKYKTAESFFKQAIKLSEKIFGSQHPSAIQPFVGYIFLLFATDRFDSAFPLVQDWENRLLSRSFQELYTSSSHKVRRLHEQTANFFMNTVPSIAALWSEETYQRYAVDVILRWKQLYAEEEAFQHQQLANSNAPEIVKLRNNLAGARIKLSQALLQKKNEEELASLMDDYNEAETALLAEAKRFKSNLEVEKVTLDRVLSALPQDSALIEYRQFRSVDLKADKTGELHIAALLLLADPKAKQRFLFRDLGPLAEIEKHLKKETAEAYKRLLGPFDDQIRSLKQLYIAPDGPLSLLSFASLRLPDGRFLAERQQINQLQTGRDLIETGKDFPRGKGLVAIGGAKYVRDSMPAGKTEPAQTLVAYQQRAVRELAEGIRYLPESRKEAQNIGEIFTKSTGEKPTVLIGEDANEHSLKQLKQPPRILHLSTHGFYLGDDKKEDGLTEQLRDEAPLLLSGLALAGANNWLQGRVVDSHGDDGLLYSLEVLGLNLHGTELVSLSACDTGKGVVDYSEGVYGLVRAFRTAGAKNVLMTLTPVGDVSSRDFMETFYDKWLSSEKNISPAEALHQTRLQFIRDKKPVQDWAPFVLVGK